MDFFSNFAYILLLGMSGMGLLMGKIRPFLTVTALVHPGKTVSGVLFLYY